MKWISVKDRLPEENKEVLCFNNSGFIVQNSWLGLTDQDDKWFKRVFTHWMPLPEPPTE